MNRIMFWIVCLWPALLAPVTASVAGGTGALPPDPGEAGKQTLLGIDSDNDGVRDDIQRWIYLTYPDNEKFRLGLSQYARGFQQILARGGDPEAVRRLAEQSMRDSECLFYIIDEDAVAVNISRELDARVVNTRERSLAYLRYGENLAGKIIRGTKPRDWKNSCSFDVDAVGGGQ